MKTPELRRYGIKGYLEYEALIPVGDNHIRIRFEGGSITGYGVAPAVFATSDPVIQTIIENSELMVSGMVKRL